jgi:Sulfotransferase family
VGGDLLHEALGGGARLVRRVAAAAERAARRRADAVRSKDVRLPGGYRRIYHVHVRKTGGTSVNRAFLALGGEDPMVVHRRMGHALHATSSGAMTFAAHDVPMLRAGRYFYGWHHAPAWSFELPADTFTFTVLRDPTARVVSLYRYLADPAADADEPFPAGRAERRRAADGFGAFLERSAPEDLCHQLWMFSATMDVEEAAARIQGCSAWLLTEDLDRSLPLLGSRLGLELAPRRDRRSLGATDVVGPHADRLAELLAPEYELFALLSAVQPRGTGLHSEA